MFQLVLDRAADSVPTEVTWRVLSFSKQAFDKWKSAPLGSGLGGSPPIHAAVDVHADDPALRYRFIWRYRRIIRRGGVVR